MAVTLQGRDRDVQNSSQEPPAPTRVGHIYLDVRRKALRYLNDTARQLHQEGIPLSPEDLQRWPLQTWDGKDVIGGDLPLIAAWRKEKPFHAEFVLPREGGLVWRLICTATPVRDRSDKLMGVLGSVTCLQAGPDHQKLAELAHDMRTPLQSLRLYCSLLGKLAPANPELTRPLEGIVTAADRALQIAMDLLESCRGPRHKKKDEIGWYPLDTLLASLASEQAAAAEAKGLELAAELTPAQGWQIYTDHVRLGRVISNLLVNAVRYTPLGRVEFSASWRDSAGTKSMALSVVDTGRGIPPEEQESIFQPFERGKVGKESDSGGSGLGLAVVDRLVEELGLELEVYSEYGRGSAFHLLVPGAILRELPPK